MDALETFYGPNAGYVLGLYERYKQDPTSVDSDTRAFFDSWSPESSMDGHDSYKVSLADEQTVSVVTRAQPANGMRGGTAVGQDVARIVAASALAHAIRERGHLGAHLDPLGSEPLGDPALEAATYGLTEADLAHMPPDVVGGHSAEGVSNALEAIYRLRAMYSGTISYEFDQVKSPDERLWLRDAVGLGLYHHTPTTARARKLLKRLIQVEAFERFLHQAFPGQKRFSIEGTDVLVPMLDEIINGALDSETREVIIGMAHRGRLNVLAHVLGKPYAAILSEFSHATPKEEEDNIPHTEGFGFGWTGDVKYHLGAEHDVLGDDNIMSLKVVLAPNPSHLEFVNPVIEGMTRASQEIRSVAGAPLQDVDHTLPILIHGDAAFPGEGVVAETLNLWQLEGYWVGGTIHIIVNNQLGFTTGPEEGRSTHFASDLAKGFEVPIIHVNADDPYACLTAVRIAHAYRDHFHKDILIDLVGYRRWGHNEGDEPGFTQPQMYEIIRSHPTVRELLAERLEKEGTVTREEVDVAVKESFSLLEQAKQEADSGAYQPVPLEVAGTEQLPSDSERPAQVSADELRALNEELLTWPKGFTVNPKLARTLGRRANTLGPEGGIDWGQAEALAFASLLTEGVPIRLTGQDSERGTFSHRHAVLHSQADGDTYIPLQHLSSARASFAIYNSPLSEVGTLGFEYGYSTHAPEALVLWEAQFGDFANSAQVIIDQFIASGRAKWRQDSSLILLLPHGYEGQGPEHSSGRLERYLQLAADDNWRIANCSTSAQYYHLLRLQAFYLQRYPRPLIIMTPKSLLRHPLSSSRLRDLTEGTFLRVLDDQRARLNPDRVKRVILCTGKIGVDLLASELRAQRDDVAIVRVELLYPFPTEEVEEVLAGYPQAHKVVWVQEEPRNMGAWHFVEPYLVRLAGPSRTVEVVSRPDRSSPATGFWDLYVAEQQLLMMDALQPELIQQEAVQQIEKR